MPTRCRAVGPRRRRPRGLADLAGGPGGVRPARRELQPYPDRNIPSASASFFSPLNTDGETVAGAAFFIETGAVGPLGIRTELLEQVRGSQTGTEPVRGPEGLDVPGSAGASRIDHDLPGDRRPSALLVPSLLVLLGVVFAAVFWCITS